MRINIKRSNLSGEIQCPPSKSYTHRAIVIASLADGKSRLSNVLLSRDTRATMNCCRLLGIEIHNDNPSTVKDHRANVIVNSKGGKFGFLTPNDVLPADNSGTTIRLLTSLCALVSQGYSVLTGDDSLRKRPMRDLIKSLNQLGVDCFSTNSSFFPPVIVKGGGIEGGKTQINGGISSQFISSLLLSGVYSKKGVTIEVLGKQVSKPYIESTIHIMRYFGVNIQNDVNDSIDEISEQSNLTESKSNTSIDNIVTESYAIPPNLSYKPREFSVPGDFSTAALLISAAFLSRGQLTIKGLNFDMPQGDMEIIDIVKSMGGHVSTDRIKGTATVDGNSSLSGGVFDLRKTPDLLPVLAILSLVAKGTTRIEGILHARFKETDRVANIASQLTKMGALITEKNDSITIQPPTQIKNTAVESFKDHRLFMAFTIAGLATDKSIVDGAESVDVSYPHFVKDLKALGANIEVLEI